MYEFRVSFAASTSFSRSACHHALPVLDSQLQAAIDAVSLEQLSFQAQQPCYHRCYYQSRSFCHLRSHIVPCNEYHQLISPFDNSPCTAACSDTATNKSTFYTGKVGQDLVLFHSCHYLHGIRLAWLNSSAF